MRASASLKCLKISGFSTISKTTNFGDLAGCRQARHDDDRKRRIGRPDFPEHRDTVEPGQADVEHDCVRALARQIGETVLAGVLDGRLVTLGAESFRENMSDGFVVLDQEELHRVLLP